MIREQDYIKRLTEHTVIAYEFDSKWAAAHLTGFELGIKLAMLHPEYARFVDNAFAQSGIHSNGITATDMVNGFVDDMPIRFEEESDSNVEYL